MVAAVWGALGVGWRVCGWVDMVGCGNCQGWFGGWQVAWVGQMYLGWVWGVLLGLGGSRR